MYMMGIDIGTTGTKAIVFDLNGKIITNAYRTYPLHCPELGWRELNPSEVLDSVKYCIKRCCAHDVGQHIGSIAVSAQGEAMVALDSQNNILGNTMVSFDTRNIEVVEKLKEHPNLEDYEHITGIPLHTMFSVSKLLYIKKNEPTRYSNTALFLTFGDFISHWLSGIAVMDYSSASRTMLFDVQNKNWNTQMIEELGLDENKLPQLAPCGTAIGTILPEIAAQLNLNPSAIITTGGHDQICCALGAGILEAGIAMNSMGTTDTILCVRDTFPTNNDLINANIPCGSYCTDNLYACHSFVLSTGSLIEWCKKTFFPNGTINFEQLNNYISENPAPNEVFLLPHFSGSGTPWMDSSSKGIIAGITLDTTPFDIYHGVLEGICFELKLNLENMIDSGADIHTIKCIGGASSSIPYLQLKADIYNRPIIMQNITEAGCLGAALLSAYGAELITDLHKNLESITQASCTIFPDKTRAELYQAKYQKFKNLYSANKQLYS